MLYQLKQITFYFITLYSYNYTIYASWYSFVAVTIVLVIFLIQKSILDTKLNFYKVPFCLFHRMMQIVLVNRGTTLAFQKNVTFLFPYCIAFGLLVRNIFGYIHSHAYTSLSKFQNTE